MNVRIEPGVLSGTVTAPPSKSIAHRLIVSALLAQGVSRIDGIDLSDDIMATIRCVNALGAETEYENGTLIVRGTGKNDLIGGATLDCGECGSTLRFLLPILLLTDEPGTLTGSEKLLSRPMTVYETICREKGYLYESGKGAIRAAGKLQSGVYTLPGNVSSQFISGLMFALPLTQGDSVIRITEETESRPYIDLTRQTLNSFGVSVRWDDAQTLYIPGNQQYKAVRTANEGDWSNAAVFFAAQACGHPVDVTGVKEDSLQGDRICRRYLEMLKAPYAAADLTNCPDLGPVLFAFAALNRGGRFTGTKRLRIKESDRVQAMARELDKFGCRITVNENEAVVPHVTLQRPQIPLCGHNDHRIVMSMALLCLQTGGVIKGAEAVKKSYPSFFGELERLGGKVTYEA